MFRVRDVVAVFRPRRGLVDANGRCILAVRQDDDRGIAKQALQRHRIVNQHVSGGRSHEGLDARRVPDLERADLLELSFVAPR